PVHPTSAPALHPLSLHDALPIWRAGATADELSLAAAVAPAGGVVAGPRAGAARRRDRALTAPRTAGLPRAGPGLLARLPGGGARSESTRLNSSHVKISYAVFCLK